MGEPQRSKGDGQGMSINEDIVEQAALSILTEMGYACAGAGEIAPDGSAPERDAYSEVILLERLTATVERLNPAIPEDARAGAIKQMFITETPSLVEENRRRAAIALGLVGLSEGINYPPADLSGGQKQCVAVDRALVGNPSLVLAYDRPPHSTGTVPPRWSIFSSGSQRPWYGQPS